MKRLAAACTLLVFTACSKPVANAAGGHGATVTKGAAILDLVPADSPYVMAMLEPFPIELMESWLAVSTGLLDKAGADLKTASQAMGGSPEETLLRVSLALLEEFRGNMSADGFARMGIGRRAQFVMYGIAVLPAMRWRVADAGKVEALILRVLAKAKVTLRKQSLAGQAYWEFTDKDIVVALARIGDEVVVGMATPKTASTVLPLLFGQKKPARSLRASGALAKVVEGHRFSPFFVGYVDFKQLARLLMRDGQGVDAQLMPLLLEKDTPVPAECKTELQALLDLAPRMVVGYEKLTAKTMTAVFVLETRADVTRRLAALKSPVPGLELTPTDSPLFMLGGGINIPRAIALAQEVAALLAAKPFRCPKLDDLEEAGEEMARTLATPLPPAIAGLQGGVVVVDDFQPPFLIRAHGLIAHDKPQELLTLALGMALPGLTVKDDGRAVRLPLEQLGLPPMPAFIGTKGKLIAAALGAGADTEVLALFGAKTGPDAPLLAFGYDVAKFVGIAKMFGAPADMSALTMLGSWGWISLAVHVTERGLTMKVAMDAPNVAAGVLAPKP